MGHTHIVVQGYILFQAYQVLSFAVIDPLFDINGVGSELEKCISVFLYSSLSIVQFLRLMFFNSCLCSCA